MPFLKSRQAVLLLAPGLLLLIVALLVPMFFLLQYSLLDGDVTLGTRGNFTLENYTDTFRDPLFMRVVGKTFLISAIVSLFALVLSFPLAALMWRVSPVWRSPLTVLVLSPLLVSMVASSYGWVILLGNKGFINSTLMALGLISEPIPLLYTDLSIGIGLLHIVLPFMVLCLLASLDRIEPALPEAAAVLGASRWRTWMHVLLPLCIPGIGAGLTLTFALCISAYVTPAVLGPSGPNFVTTLIYQSFINLYQWGAGSAMALMLVVVALLMVAGLGSAISRLGPQQRTADE